MVNGEPFPSGAGLDRIASSPPFLRAARSRQLLRHLCEKVAGGRQAEIKEATIAAEVFRRESYDPQVDSVVRVEMARLRKALEEYYAGPGSADLYRIEIPKGSYVPVVRPVARRSVRRPRWWLAVPALIAAAVWAVWFAALPNETPPSIPAFQIQPFQAIEGGPLASESARRLTDEIVTRLANIRGIRVVTHDAPGNQVHAIVEGTVSVNGERIRVVARLRTNRHGVHFWAAESEGKLAERADVERKAAETVERVFPLEFAHVRRALVRQTTRSPEAFYYYLRASHLAGGDLSQMREALSLLRAAIAADPDHPLAYAAKAQLLSVLFSYGEFPEAGMAEARTAVEDALARRPHLAEARRAKGNISILLDRDWEGAEREFRAAIAADPAYPEAHHDFARFVLTPRGRFDEALAELDQALALSPLEIDFQLERANALIKAGRSSEALARLKTIRPGPAQNVLTAMAAFLEGRPADAERALEEAMKYRRGSWALGHYGYLLAATGRSREAEAVLDELTRRRPHPYIDIAAIECGLGRESAARQTLKLGAKHPAALWLDVDYRFRSLRAAPTAAALAPVAE